MERDLAVEYSSKIRSFEFKNGKAVIILYYTTKPARFEKEVEEPWRRAPGMGDVRHGELLDGHKRKGHIHLHWKGSEVHNNPVNGMNQEFSNKDKKINSNANNDEYNFYILGSTGILKVSYARDTSSSNGNRMERILKEGLYNGKNVIPSIKHVYRQ